MINPERLDQLCREYREARAAEDAAAAVAKEKRDRLLKLVTEHGARPEGADKSKRLEGIEFKATASYGQSISVDASIAEKFQQALHDAGLKQVCFDLFFTVTKTYQIAIGAFERMAINDLGLAQGHPLPCARKLRSLFRRAVTINAKTPTLKVEPRIVAVGASSAKAAKSSDKRRSA